MKVVQVLYSGLGGHGSVALSLLDASRGAWSNAMIFVGIEPVLSEYRRRCEAAGVEYLHVRTRPGRAWAAWPALFAALRQARPDAILLHSVKTIVPCALYARSHGVPLVAVEHQNNELKHRTEWWVSALLMRHADAVVVLTDEYRGFLQKRLGRRFRNAKVHVIANGVDTDAFAPPAAATWSAVRTGPHRIGMASRFTAIKRQDVLVDALALMRAGGGTDWRLSLAGDGETLGALREQVREHGLESAVEFPGYLGETALREWFGTLDIYAHASEGESLSTSLLQALASGLPIVASDVPGIDNLLGLGGGTGLAVEQTPGAFVAAFRRLESEPALVEDLRRRARALALKDYGQSAMFDRYEMLVRR